MFSVILAMWALMMWLPYKKGISPPVFTQILCLEYLAMRSRQEILSLNLPVLVNLPMQIPAQRSSSLGTLVQRATSWLLMQKTLLLMRRKTDSWTGFLMRYSRASPMYSQSLVKSTLVYQSVRGRIPILLILLQFLAVQRQYYKLCKFKYVKNFNALAVHIVVSVKYSMKKDMSNIKNHLPSSGPLRSKPSMKTHFLFSTKKSTARLLFLSFIPIFIVLSSIFCLFLKGNFLGFYFLFYLLDLLLFDIIALLLFFIIHYRQFGFFLNMAQNHVDDGVEESLDVFARLGRYFKVSCVILLCLLLSLLLSHAFFLQVYFVAYINYEKHTHKHFNRLRTLVIFKHIIPDLEISQGLGLGTVINQNCAMGIFHIVGDQTSESFLSGCVPQLYSVMLAVSSYVFDVEVDAHCRLLQEIYYVETLLELVLDVLFDDGGLAD